MQRHLNAFPRARCATGAFVRIAATRVQAGVDLGYSSARRTRSLRERVSSQSSLPSPHAAYGQAMLKRLAQDLTARLGRGFSERNIWQMRLFYLGWPIPQTLSAESASPAIWQTLSAKSGSWPQFPLPWSHYVRLLSVADPKARAYYEREALHGGWSVRQLDRQIATLAYQRTGSARSPAKDVA